MTAILLGGVLGGAAAIVLLVVLDNVFGSPHWPWSFIAGYAMGSFGARVGIAIAKAFDPDWA